MKSLIFCFGENYSFTPHWSKVNITVANKDKNWKPVYQINFPKLSPLERDTIVRNRLTEDFQ